MNVIDHTALLIYLQPALHDLTRQYEVLAELIDMHEQEIALQNQKIQRQSGMLTKARTLQIRGKKLHAEHQLTELTAQLTALQFHIWHELQNHHQVFIQGIRETFEEDPALFVQQLLAFDASAVGKATGFVAQGVLALAFEEQPDTLKDLLRQLTGNSAVSQILKNPPVLYKEPLKLTHFRR